MKISRSVIGQGGSLNDPKVWEKHWAGIEVASDLSFNQRQREEIMSAANFFAGRAHWYAEAVNEKVACDQLYYILNLTNQLVNALCGQPKPKNKGKASSDEEQVAMEATLSGLSDNLSYFF